MSTKTTEFKVGDVVYSQRFGVGIVVEILPDYHGSAYPVRCKFDEDGEEQHTSFAIDGVYLVANPHKIENNIYLVNKPIQEDPYMITTEAELFKALMEGECVVTVRPHKIVYNLCMDGKVRGRSAIYPHQVYDLHNALSSLGHLTIQKKATTIIDYRYENGPGAIQYINKDDAITIINHFTKVFNVLGDREKNATRYEFLRDDQNWGADTDERPGNWEELNEQTLGFFDNYVDAIMTESRLNRLIKL